MKIAFTYNKEDKTIFQHFGDIDNFLIVDLATNTEEIIGNGGFSHKALVPYLKSHDVNILICGGIGEPAIALFAMLGIQVIPGVSGLVSDVLEQYKNGSLKADYSFVHKCGCHNN